MLLGNHQPNGTTAANKKTDTAWLMRYRSLTESF